MTVTTTSPEQTSTAPYRRMWCELTNKCQLACVHCYADSGPGAASGAMTGDDWIRVIGQARADGVDMVQLIGGEPTMHPEFTRIMGYALGIGLDVEVYSNLVRVTDEMWELFQRPKVSLAFSYYSPDAAAHNAVTQRPTHAATRRNAVKAVALGITIRAGVIDFGHRQEAVDDLRSMGITRIATDRVRHVGRGGTGIPEPSELCGHCGQDVAAVSADGDVTPCIFSRWMKAGNVRETPLAGILGSPSWTAALSAVPAPRAQGCPPDTQECNPGTPPSTCEPRY